MKAGELQRRLSARGRFGYLARRVEPAVADRVKALDLPGVHELDEPKRFLPAGDLAVPLLGKVGTDNEGQGGLEAQYEHRLAGTPGAVRLERDPNGRDIPGGVQHFEPSTRGEDLVLTLDRSMQYEAEQALAAEIVAAHARGGIAAVMQSDTGEVLAMANLTRAGDPARPGDPAGVVVPAQSTTALTNVYEPGSVNKMITVAGSLEQGAIAPGDRMTVPDHIKVSDALFHDDEDHPVKQWSITDIVANSSNVGTIMIGRRLGKERIDQYLRAFGFGRRTGLGFPGESAGLLLDPARWYSTSIGTVPIGQGVAVTAMQMLAAYNTIANGGTYVAPKLVKASIDGDGKRHDTPPSDRHRVVSERTAAEVTAMLGEVVRVGTGKLAAIDGYGVAGKTGTARKPLDGARGYKEGAYVSSFVGFVPAARPAITAMVVLDEPTPIYGGLVAAPVFAELARYGLRELRVPPPAGPAPTPQVPLADPQAAATEGGQPPIPVPVPGPGGTASGTGVAGTAITGTGATGTGATGTGATGTGATGTGVTTQGALSR
jgi:cell division protein FtsI (penicillin-binding protein 3)